MALQDAPEQVEEFVSLLNKFEQVNDGHEVSLLFRKLRCILGNHTELLRDFAAFLHPEQALQCGLVSMGTGCGQMVCRYFDRWKGCRTDVQVVGLVEKLWGMWTDCRAVGVQVVGLMEKLLGQMYRLWDCWCASTWTGSLTDCGAGGHVVGQVVGHLVRI